MDTPTEPARGFRIIDVIAVVVILAIGALLIDILLMDTRGRHGLSPRTQCAANLKGIGTGLYTYANENDDKWPVPQHTPASQPETGPVRYAPGIIGKDRMRETTPADREVSTTRSLWLLIRNGASTPRSFICPVSNDTAFDEDNPQIAWDFESWDGVSYGIQVPFGTKGLASSNCDARMPLAADKGPYSAALEKKLRSPGVPTALPGSKDKEWRPWNSPNHEGEGQCVLYPDGHADYLTKPLSPLPGPAAGDNIYTRWASAEAGKEENILQRAQGTPPTGIETPWSDTDTLIYP